MIHERADEFSADLYNAHGPNGPALHVPVPLPTEIPPPPNLSQLPAHILHSGTVETLIGQNEDLMARLKVNIRRNSVLEQQIMEQDRINQELTLAYNSLVAQFQVLQEKDEMWREKSSTVDARHNALIEQIELMEAKVEAAEERRDELQAGLKFEQAYRRRVRAWVRPYLNDLRHQTQEARQKATFLDRQLASREATIGDLRARMNETVTQMQNVTRSANQDQALLVEKYESRMKAAEADAAKARSEFQLYKDKALRLDDAISSQTAAENRIVYLERRNREMESALGGEMREIQEQVAMFRQEAKNLAAEVMTAHEERDLYKAQATDAIASESRIQDQFESLQSVWSEAQKKFEASKLQQDSLNKLNQELSRQLRSDRKAREGGSFEIETVAELTPAPLKVDTKQTAQSLDRIDNLLAALEAGFTKARGSEAQVNGLEIVEPESAKQKPRDLDREASL